MTYTIYSYDTDPRYRVTSVAHWRQGNPTPLAEIACPSRDGAGNPLSMTDWTGSTTYTYDANRRLDSAVYPGTGLVDYNYDWVGNRDNPPPDPNGLVFDAADRLLGWPGRYSYNYYPDGSQREVRDGMGVLLRTYSYTPAGLLGRVDYPGQISPAFHYWDGDGNRVRYLPRDLPDIYTFVYDITAGIPAVVEKIDEDSGTTTLYYREPDGSLVARARYGVYRFYHFDALGSTRILTDGSGNVTDRYSYDAWGNVTPDPNNLTPDNPYQYVGQLGYYTHYQEPEFGLLQLGVRFYNAETGRFTQRDRGWSESVGYSYINDRPMIAADPTGLSWDGPPPAKITAKMCRDACEESGFNPTVCRQACALLKNASCAGLKALINHLRRHQSHVAQMMADALMAVYFYFNCDIGKKACSTGIRQ